MGVRVLWVDGEPHQRSRTQEGVTVCSCGRMAPVSGGANSMANEWHAHVHAEAEASGVEVVKIDGGKVLHDVKTRAVACLDCGWQGGRKTPWVKYQGPVGPCPKCAGRVYAVGLDFTGKAPR